MKRTSLSSILQQAIMACPHHTKQAHIVLQDDCVETFANEFTHLKPLSVAFNLKKNPTDIKGLRETLQAVAAQECKVGLQLHYHWQRPTNGASDDFLAILIHPNAKCQLTAFSGCLSGQFVSLLPTTLKDLKLAIANGDQLMQAALAELTHRITELSFLSLHVVPGTPLDVLHEVKGRNYGPHLLLSGVGDNHVGWACDTARKLQPHNSWWKYWTLRLPNSTLSRDGCMQLLRGLTEQGVTVWECDIGILVSSPSLNADGVQHMRGLANDLLQCSFSCVRKDIWQTNRFYVPACDSRMIQEVMNEDFSEEEEAVSNLQHR